MLPREFVFIFLGLSICCSATGQRIEGLSKMDTNYIHLFTFYEDQDTLTEEMLSIDLQRIRNIPGIGQAVLVADENGKPVIQVKEVNTLLPIINFGGVTDNVWYRLGLSDINLLGQGKSISTHYQNSDRRHGGQIYYKDPFLIGTKWGYSLDVNRWASLEPLFFDEGRVNYEFQYNSIAASVIRNFGIQKNLEIGANYFVEDYEKSTQQVLDNPPGPAQLVQPKFLFNSSYQENMVNYNFFLLDGYIWRLAMQNVYNIDDKNWFNIIQFRLRRYIKLRNFGNIALRFKLAFSTNNYSPFAPFVVDSHVNLRGVGNRIDRGTGQAVLNAEYRQTLLNVYPFGIQFVVFTDLGTWRNPGGDLSELVSRSAFRQYVGGGFRFVYQQIFGATIRIDYGVDVFDPRQRGFVIGLGQYF